MTRSSEGGSDVGVLVWAGSPSVRLLWHPLPLPPGVDGAAWVRLVTQAWTRESLEGARWGTAARPGPGWLPPDGWGEPVAALARYGSGSPTALEASQ